MDERDQKLHDLLGSHAEKFPHQLAARFPHIIERLVGYWGTTQMDPYFTELLVADGRRGHRQGFPPEVASEIFALSMLHDTLFPKGVVRKPALVEATEFEQRDRHDEKPEPTDGSEG